VVCDSDVCSGLSCALRCRVINLNPNKQQVYSEIYMVLKPGRLGSNCDAVCCSSPVLCSARCIVCCRALFALLFSVSSLMQCCASSNFLIVCHHDLNRRQDRHQRRGGEGWHGDAELAQDCTGEACFGCCHCCFRRLQKVEIGCGRLRGLVEM
jgi:hypothetical protein